ncbi:hypothetical protein N183_29355 [Sinorhizobium sp. Sb3]|nr:hypothetical protein N183_29355 [Sinorhizobium sp. Sb3]
MISERSRALSKARYLLKRILRYLSWPLVFFSGLLGSYFAFASTHPMIAFATVYAAAVFVLFLLERYIPYERRWLLSDGETVNDIGHTLATKGLLRISASRDRSHRDF